MQLREISGEHYPEALNLWEVSVRATHDFLPDGWIEDHRTMVLEKYFPLVQMHGVFSDEEVLMGFSGVLNENLEMLFIHPDYSSKGIGSHLVKHAIRTLNVNKVDVNEQNRKALTFYLSQGFEIVSRSEFDAQGNPFPLLHLQLKK
jgi:putative acetyltransferase